MNGLEQFAAVLALLDQVFTPAFAIAITRRLGDPAQRVAADVGEDGILIAISILVLRLVFSMLRLNIFRFSSGLIHRSGRLRHRLCFNIQHHADRLRQIHEAHRRLATQSVLNGLPFRGKFGERIINGAARFGGIVDQQGHRRFHAGIRSQRQ